MLGSAPLSPFVHAIETSIAINLGFSALFQLGKVAGNNIDEWIYKEKLRVIPPLAERPEFDSNKFIDALNNWAKRFKVVRAIVNAAGVMWALAAAVFGIVLLVLMPFEESKTISRSAAYWWALILYGPMPLSLITHALVHSTALSRMTALSAKYETFLTFFKQEPADKVAEARAALKKKLDDERDNGR